MVNANTKRNPVNLRNLKKLKQNKAKQKTKQQEIDNLLGNDLFAKRSVKHFIAEGKTKDQALRIYVNGVNGDVSQLPAPLAKYANNKGWLQKREKVDK